MSNATIYCTHQRCPNRGDNLTEAAEAGTFGRLNEHLDHLDSVVAPNGNTILHIHLSYQREISTGFFHVFDKQISTDFIEQVVVKCPRLLSQENCDGNTPLHIAASHGYTDVAEELIWLAETLHDALDARSGEVAINILHNEVDIESGEVATERAMEVVREMLRKVNKEGETALHVAARNGRSLGVVKAILSKEDPHFTYPVNNFGETPLYLAVDNTCTNIVAELLNNPNSQSLDYRSLNGDTVLHKAVERWDTETVRMLLEKQCRLVKEQDFTGWTPLHVAAYEGSSSMVATLLDKDISIAYDMGNYFEATALHIAAGKGYKHVVNEIISKCPDCCKLTNGMGLNVLHFAILSKNEEVLEAILKNSWSISLIIGKDDGGNTPVHLFKALNLPLPSFILNGDTDTFILWKKLYYDIPSNFTIKNFLYLLPLREDIFHVAKQKSEEIYTVMKHKYKTEMGEKREEKIINHLEKARESHLVAAALVATVTFAAAFTLPGGYTSDKNDSKEGTPILSRNTAFKAFVISDTVAMVLSISSVFMYFITATLGYKPKYYWLIKTAFRFVFLAMGAMVVGFVTGNYAVLTPSLELAIATCVIGLSFFLFFLFIFIRLMPSSTSGLPRYDDGRVLTLSWLSCGGWWLKNFIKKRLCAVEDWQIN